MAGMRDALRIAMLALCASCSGSLTCDDALCLEGSVECRGDAIVVCERQSSGCVGWSEPSPCAPRSCSLGACSDTCTDECATGERRCAGDAVQTCGQGDSDACTDWLAPVACASGEACSGGACGGACADACTGTERRCSGDGVIECGDRDGDGCREYGPVVPCGAGESCDAGACVPIGSCTDECTESGCDGDFFEACGDFDSDPCMDRSAGTPCGSSDPCVIGSCAASGCVSAPVVCDAPPASSCTDADTLRVYDALGVCGAGGCTYPFTDTTCPMGCAGGACVTSGCSPGPVTTTTANPSPPAASSVHASVFDGRCGAAVGQIFPPSAPWNQSVRTTCVDPSSRAVIDYLEAVVTGSQTFRIDMGTSSDLYGFNPLAADDSVTHRSFTPTGDFFTTHCDHTPVPVPAMGRLEGEANYTCSSDGDCHLTVFDTAECRLFEMWRANDALGSFAGGCLSVWTNTHALAADLRGLSCTSADAAGFPIMPMLITPQEIRAGRINHALRFILPNNAVQRRVYVRPATHNPLSGGSPTAGPAGTMAPPYGVRLRLRADFPTAGRSPGARAIIEALKEFGMFHADGGNVTFIASNDVYSTARWSDADIALSPSELRSAGMRWTDFEVVSDLSDTESMSSVSCSRTPL